MTTKPLILGVVTALAMAGGQAYAVPCSNTTVGALEVASFECTSGNFVFENFGITNVPTATMVNFSGSDITVHKFNSTATSGSFDYTLAIAPTAPPLEFTTASANQTTPGGPTAAHVTLTFSVNGNAAPAISTTGSTETLSVSGTSLNVGNALVIPAGATENLLRNTFTSQTPVAPVPEPMSLSLFGLGLTGLWFARRRRS